MRPFVSTVDNAWLAAALLRERNAHPAHAASASALLDRMDFRPLYDAGAGLFRGGRWPDGGGGLA